MPPPFPRLLIATLAALLLAAPAQAQGLDLDLELEGLGLDVDLGSESGGLGVDADLGDTGLDLDLDAAGLDLDLGLDGTGELLDQSPVTLGPDGALAAVRSGKALPLEDILLRARLIADGEVIDAQLIAVSDVLLYEIKVLAGSGDVGKLYFHARSGAPVGTN